MKYRTPLVTVLLLFGLGLTELGMSQDNIDADSKFLTIGDVRNIDSKGKFITIGDATSYNIEQLRNAGGGGAPAAGRAGGGSSAGGRGSGRGGGGGGRGGRRGGNGGGSGGTVGTNRGASAPIPMEYKVTVSSKTVVKDGETEIKLDDLKAGDRIQVFSMKGGTKLEATEIIRTPKSNS